MKESSLDVKLLEIPVEAGGEMEDCVEGFKVDSVGSRLVIVDAITLHKSFSHIPNLVTYNLAQDIAFPFATKFPFSGL